MAARVEPRRVQGAHQSLHHFVANADWSQEDLLRRVRTFVLPAIEKRGRINAWIVDDTGFPKKGVHSVGVARQYCGQLGKQDRQAGQLSDRGFAVGGQRARKLADRLSALSS